MTKLIALTGYSQTGKYTLGSVFMAGGFQRLTMEDVTKHLFNPLCEEHLGFSAFAELPEQEEQMKPLFVHGRRIFYNSILLDYFKEVDILRSKGVPIINTRLFSIREARMWRMRGGKIYEVYRPDVGPRDREEETVIADLLAEDLIDGVVENSGSLRQFYVNCSKFARSVTRDKEGVY